MNKTKTVQLDGKTVTVKKLPLGKYAQLLEAVETLPKSVGGLDGLSNDDIFAQLPKIIAKSLPEIIKIISIASDLPEDEVAGMGLDEVIRMLKAIGEVNNYGEVLDTIKKALANQKLPAKAQ